MTLAELGAAAVQPPPGRSKIVTFDSLKIATVWAYLTAATVNPVARLPYVVRIESSEDEHTILAQASSPPVNPAATDIGWNLLRVRAPDLWRDVDATGQRQLSPTGWQSAGVAVLDDGGDYRQRSPETNWQFFFAFATNPGNFTADTTSVFLGQHGTDLGSLVAGEPNNLWGAGVAPRAALAFTKVLPSDDDWGPIVQGLDRAYSDGWAVVLMGFGNCGALPPSTVQTAVSWFSNRVPADAAHPGVGVSLVAPAGNGTLTSPTPCPTTAVAYPAAYPEVIAVAALDQTNATRQGFSVGPKVELSAPGICVNGLLVGGGDHPCLTGTSFAAAHVAGLIAAIRAQNNTWSAADVRARLQEAATKITGQALPRDDRFGYGLINAYAAAQDTTRPPVPPTPNLPDDSTFTVPSPSGSSVRYHRNIVVIAFDDSTSGTTVRRILRKYDGVIIGGSEARDEPAYYVQIPDPGTTFAAMDSVTSLIRAESGVKRVRNPTWRGLIRIRSRYPEDGPQSTRSDWFSPTDATRALLAIRAPLAWGCETGMYTTRPNLGLIDWVFNAHTDLQVAETVVPSAVRFEQLTIERIEHGNMVAGIAAATGDNGEGIAGVAWGSELHLYGLGSQIFTAQDPVEEYQKAFEKARKAGVRVLTSSVSAGEARDAQEVSDLQSALEAYLAPGNVFVYALPNNNQRPTLEQVRQTQDTLFTALDRAVSRARERFGDRIINVAGTGLDSALLSMSDYWTNGTDVLAPGQDISTLAHSDNATTVVDSGNSFAAPFVAGTAALLRPWIPPLPPRRSRTSSSAGRRCRAGIRRRARSNRLNQSAAPPRARQFISSTPTVLSSSPPSARARRCAVIACGSRTSAWWRSGRLPHALRRSY